MFLTSKMEMFERKKLRINEKPKNPLNSRKTQEKRALFGFKGAGKVSKKKPALFASTTEVYCSVIF